jgi:hypothetical protein
VDFRQSIGALAADGVRLTAAVRRRKRMEIIRVRHTSTSCMHTFRCCDCNRVYSSRDSRRVTRSANFSVLLSSLCECVAAPRVERPGCRASSSTPGNHRLLRLHVARRRLSEVQPPPLQATAAFPAEVSTGLSPSCSDGRRNNSTIGP